MAKREAKTDGTHSFPRFVSMQACAAATGIPLPILKAAKKDGCAAFKPNNAVDLGQFIAFYFSRLGGEVEEAGDGLDAMEWGERKKRADALFMEQRLREREGRSIDIEIVERVHQRAGIFVRTELEKVLGTEIPPRTAGRKVEDVREINLKAVESVCASLADRLAAVMNEVAKEQAAEDAREEGDDAA